MDIEKVLRKYHLIDKYLGDYVRCLSQKPPDAKPLGEVRFWDIFDRDQPERLERRLERTHNTEAFETIFQEIGNISDSDELDRRLVAAWAEVRVLDQLLCEKFIDIRKAKDMISVDFVGRRTNQLYAIQVTKISRDAPFADLPTGSVDQIDEEVGSRIGKYFWDSLKEKNSELRKVSSSEYVRRVVLVTTTYRLQDALNRHMACRRIGEAILALTSLHFEEAQWLLDGGDNAIFWVETDVDRRRVRCVADWIDKRTELQRRDYDNCYWREIDLHVPVPQG
jgi:hypothetical protein